MEHQQKLMELMNTFKHTAQSLGIHPHATVFASGMLAGLIGVALVEDQDYLPEDAKTALRATFSEGIDFIMDAPRASPGVAQ